MNGVSLILLACRVATVAVLAVVAGLTLAQVTRPWRPDMSGAPPIATAESLLVPSAIADRGPDAMRADDLASWPIPAASIAAPPELPAEPQGPSIGVVRLGAPPDLFEVRERSMAEAVERLGALPPLPGDPGPGDGLVAADPSPDRAAERPAEHREAAQPTQPPPRQLQRRARVRWARPSAARSAQARSWLPSWLRWPAIGSSAGIAIDDSRYGGGGR